MKVPPLGVILGVAMLIGVGLQPINPTMVASVINPMATFVLMLM